MRVEQTQFLASHDAHDDPTASTRVIMKEL